MKGFPVCHLLLSRLHTVEMEVPLETLPSENEPHIVITPYFTVL